MRTVALIIVAREAEGEAGPTAFLPMAGRTLIEHQARRAADAGVAELLVVAERMPVSLAAALDRLRQDGMVVRVALGIADAVQKVAPEETLLLIADGVLPEERAVTRLLREGVSPALLVHGDAPDVADRERLDAANRWAGLALMDGAELTATAAMLGDWDLELTLVRRLVGRAGTVAVPPEAARPVASAAAARAEVAGLARGGPIARAVLDRIMDWRVSAAALGQGAAVLAWIGALLLGFGPLVVGLAALLAATPLERLARRLARMRLEPRRLLPARLRLAGMAAALPLYGWRLSGAPGFEPLLLGAASLVFLIAARNERRITGLVRDRWAPRPDWMLWAATPAALAGYGRWALAALALWAGAGFFRLQVRALKGRDSKP